MPTIFNINGDNNNATVIADNEGPFNEYEKSIVTRRLLILENKININTILLDTWIPLAFTINHIRNTLLSSTNLLTVGYSNFRLPFLHNLTYSAALLLLINTIKTTTSLKTCAGIIDLSGNCKIIATENVFLHDEIISMDTLTGLFDRSGDGGGDGGGDGYRFVSPTFNLGAYIICILGDELAKVFYTEHEITAYLYNKLNSLGFTGVNILINLDTLTIAILAKCSSQYCFRIHIPQFMLGYHIVVVYKDNVEEDLEATIPINETNIFTISLFMAFKCGLLNTCQGANKGNGFEGLIRLPILSFGNFYINIYPKDPSYFANHIEGHTGIYCHITDPFDIFTGIDLFYKSESFGSLKLPSTFDFSFNPINYKNAITICPTGFTNPNPQIEDFSCHVGTCSDNSRFDPNINNGKPTFFDFWASWNLQCISNFTSIRNKWLKYRADINVVSINVSEFYLLSPDFKLGFSSGYNLTTLKPVLEQHNMLWQNVTGLLDVDGNARPYDSFLRDNIDNKLWNIPAYPHVTYYDATGTLRAKTSGLGKLSHLIDIYTSTNNIKGDTRLTYTLDAGCVTAFMTEKDKETGSIPDPDPYPYGNINYIRGRLNDIDMDLVIAGQQQHIHDAIFQDVLKGYLLASHIFDPSGIEITRDANYNIVITGNVKDLDVTKDTIIITHNNTPLFRLVQEDSTYHLIKNAILLCGRAEIVITDTMADVSYMSIDEIQAALNTLCSVENQPYFQNNRGIICKCHCDPNGNQCFCILRSLFA